VTVTVTVLTLGTFSVPLQRLCKDFAKLFGHCPNFEQTLQATLVIVSFTKALCKVALVKVFDQRPTPAGNDTQR
jgi:hypothetical protein